MTDSRMRRGATIRQRFGDVLAWLAFAALVWSAVSLLAGGFVFRAGALTLASRNPIRPFLVALALAIAARLLLGREAFAARLAGVLGPSSQRPAAIALAASFASFAVAVAWNTHAAGGSDSSCYVLQAEAFARGHASLPPVLSELPPGVGAAALAPTGFITSPEPPFAAVPICGAGLALLMAPALLVSRNLVFLVVPIFAALTVWLTFALGKALTDGVTGACAAVLLACSPIFLYQAVQPMSDVPATALWLAALVFVTRGTLRAAIAAGICASLAVLVRPNLAFLVLALPLLLKNGDSPRLQNEKRGLSPFPSRAENRPDFGDPGKRGLSPFFCFIAGGAPAAAIMIALNAARYGSPFASGYGGGGVLFQLSHVWPNLARYPRWLLETQTPVIVLALAGPWILWQRGRGRITLVGSVAVILTFATYLAYTVFDDWWYIRFLLPALPVLIVFAVVAVFAVAEWLPPLARRSPRSFVATFLCLVLGGWYLHVAQTRHVFELQALESRFRIAGEYARRALPANAVIFAVQQSGSIRFHGGRRTLAWDAVEPSALDASIGWLRARGFAPYIALEDAEESPFRTRFASQDCGQLDWPPLAEVHAPVRVKIYDPTERARYLSGTRMETQHIRQ